MKQNPAQKMCRMIEGSALSFNPAGLLSSQAPVPNKPYGFCGR